MEKADRKWAEWFYTLTEKQKMAQELVEDRLSLEDVRCPKPLHPKEAMEAVRYWVYKILNDNLVDGECWYPDKPWTQLCSSLELVPVSQLDIATQYVRESLSYIERYYLTIPVRWYSKAFPLELHNIHGVHRLKIEDFRELNNEECDMAEAIGVFPDVPNEEFFGAWGQLPYAQYFTMIEFDQIEGISLEHIMRMLNGGQIQQLDSLGVDFVTRFCKPKESSKEKSKENVKILQAHPTCKNTYMDVDCSPTTSPSWYYNTMETKPSPWYW